MKKISNYDQQLLFDSELKESKHDEIVLFVYNNIELIINELGFKDKFWPDLKPSKFIKTLEYPVGKNGFVKGFLDLNIRCESIRLAGNKYKYYDGNEVTELEDKQTILYSINIEVKSKRPLLGDFIRQINNYRSYSYADYWILVAPNISDYKKILSEQAIYCFEYK